MTMIAVVGLAMLLAIVPGTAQPRPDGAAVETWTGWFSDQRCARVPAPDQAVRPNGSECVKRCLDEGSMPVTWAIGSRSSPPSTPAAGPSRFSR